MKKMILFICLATLVTPVLAQHGYSKTETEFTALQQQAKLTDSIIKADEKYIDEIISEGDITETIITPPNGMDITKLSDAELQKIADTISAKYKHYETIGGFYITTFIDKRTHKLLKASYGKTTHENYTESNPTQGNFESIEVTIYYTNMQPVYAEFIEKHYNNTQVFSQGKYYVQLQNQTGNTALLSYSYKFQKEMVTAIMDVNTMVFNCLKDF